MARTVQCIKLGQEAEGLDFPPYPGELGKRIFESVSKQAWADWLKHQTMLVNENRLNLADARARQYLARQMENHFFGAGADAAADDAPPGAWHELTDIQALLGNGVSCCTGKGCPVKELGGRSGWPDMAVGASNPPRWKTGQSPAA